MSGGSSDPLRALICGGSPGKFAQPGIGSEWPPEARQPGIKLNQPASQPREKKGLQKKGKKGKALK